MIIIIVVIIIIIIIIIFMIMMIIDHDHDHHHRRRRRRRCLPRPRPRPRPRHHDHHQYHYHGTRNVLALYVDAVQSGCNFLKSGFEGFTKCFSVHCTILLQKVVLTLKFVDEVLMMVILYSSSYGEWLVE